MPFAHANQKKNKAQNKVSTPSRHSSSKFNYKNAVNSNQDFILNLQSTIGNQAVQRLMGSNINFDFSNIPIQSKLKVSQPGDQYEQEADRISDHIRYIPEPKLTRVCPCGGGCPRCKNGEATIDRNINLTKTIQPKLKVSQPGDMYEQEADRVADQIMRMSKSTDSAKSITETNDQERIGHACSSCNMKGQEEKKNDRLNISLKPLSSSNMELSDVIADEIDNNHANSEGSPLDSNTQEFMSSRFGFEFSKVRIHTDETAARASNLANALAYTIGNDIVFGQGQYQPNSLQGRRLLAHELAHTLQQRGSAASVQRSPDPPKSPPPARPDLGVRLHVIEETGPAVGARLDQIIRTGGPIPTTTKVIGAAIIDVEGYPGPKEMRAISGADTDALGAGAAVYHASSPNLRTLSATRSIAGSGPRRDFFFAHINDAEMKLFEDIIARLPKDARGTIYFTTMRVRMDKNGQMSSPEPYPACSGCIRASLEAAGSLPEIDLVSHAPVHPPGTLNMGKPQAPHTEHDEPIITNPQGLKPGTVHMSPVDADVDPATGRVVPGPNTDAARARRAASPPGRYTGVGIGVATTIATLGLGWLAAYLKAKVDQTIAQRQIEAFREVARKKINANPDEALKKMMIDPSGTVYAWVHLDSAVITTYGVDNVSPEPATSDSSPMLDLGPIEYMTAPVDQAVVDSFPRISSGGRHSITVRTILIDIPLVTPPLEDLIIYAKSRQLPLDDLYKYALSRLQYELSVSIGALDAHQNAINALHSTTDVFNWLQAQFKIAQKRKDVELQKKLAESMLRVSQGSTSIAGDLKSISELIQKADEKVKYWQHIVDLIKLNQFSEK